MEKPKYVDKIIEVEKPVHTTTTERKSILYNLIEKPVEKLVVLEGQTDHVLQGQVDGLWSQLAILEADNKMYHGQIFYLEQECESLKNLWETHIFIGNHCKSIENQFFQWKSMQNRCKINIFIENHCKTCGKPIISMKIIAKSSENQYVH